MAEGTSIVLELFRSARQQRDADVRTLTLEAMRAAHEARATGRPPG